MLWFFFFEKSISVKHYGYCYHLPHYIHRIKQKVHGEKTKYGEQHIRAPLYRQKQKEQNQARRYH
jgi:hypothetical protein